MTTSQPSTPSGWFSGRTRLVTIVSIVAVGLAGATAVSANIGILNSASDSAVGNASAAGDLTTPATQVVDVYLPSTTAPVTTAAPAGLAGLGGVQEFAVDIAGTVAVSSTDAGVRLDGVVPASGWNWALSQSDPAALLVTMTNGARTFEFSATAMADGTIAASVNEPIVTSAPAVSGGSHEGDDGHDDGEYEGGGDDD